MVEAPGQTLLAVLAHPDDESFGTGGTLALYASRGVAVHLVCATRGEAGEVDPAYLVGYASVAERRVSELRCAASILGLAGVHFLDYRDSGMPGSPDNSHPQALINAPLEKVAARVVEHIRWLQPQVVLTFDPVGGYKHPDHIMIHRATLLAFQLAGDSTYPCELPPYQPQKLYYHVFPKRWLRLALKFLPLFGFDPRRFGRNGDIDLVDLVQSGDFPAHAVIDYRPVQEKREAAAACHASQLAGAGMGRRSPLTWLMRWFASRESYYRAYPQVEGKLRETDLFSGL